MQNKWRARAARRPDHRQQAATPTLRQHVTRPRPRVCEWDPRRKHHVAAYTRYNPTRTGDIRTQTLFRAPTTFFPLRVIGENTHGDAWATQHMCVTRVGERGCVHNFCLNERGEVWQVVYTCSRKGWAELRTKFTLSISTRVAYGAAAIDRKLLVTLLSIVH